MTKFDLTCLRFALSLLLIQEVEPHLSLAHMIVVGLVYLVGEWCQLLVIAIIAECVVLTEDQSRWLDQGSSLSETIRRVIFFKSG